MPDVVHIHRHDPATAAPWPSWVNRDAIHAAVPPERVQAVRDRLAALVPEITAALDEAVELNVAAEEVCREMTAYMQSIGAGIDHEDAVWDVLDGVTGLCHVHELVSAVMNATDRYVRNTTTSDDDQEDDTDD